MVPTNITTTMTTEQKARYTELANELNNDLDLAAAIWYATTSILMRSGHISQANLIDVVNRFTIISQIEGGAA